MTRLLLLVSVLPLLSHADEICPYLNSATASGVLGGPVTLALTRATNNKEDATCEYTRKDNALTYSMRIEVVTLADKQTNFAVYLAQCGRNPTSLRGIGNEAVVCALPKKDGQESEQVISRVRDRAFLVRISSTDPSAKHTSLRDQARNVAEQVAGNLF